MNQDERIALVDEEDRVIGYKMRSQLTDDDCWRVVAIWIENSEQQVLLQQRSHKVTLNPGLWSNAVMGTVDADDSYEDTAVREIEEELGLSGVDLIKTNRLYYKASFGWRQAQGFVVKCYWPLERFKPQPEEVAKLEWVDKQKLLNEIGGKTTPSHPYVSVYTQWPELFDLES